jgi:hypothetical protein
MLIIRSDYENCLRSIRFCPLTQEAPFLSVSGYKKLPKSSARTWKISIATRPRAHPNSQKHSFLSIELDPKSKLTISELLADFYLKNNLTLLTYLLDKIVTAFDQVFQLLNKQRISDTFPVVIQEFSEQRLFEDFFIFKSFLNSLILIDLSS